MVHATRLDAPRAPKAGGGKPSCKAKQETKKQAAAPARREKLYYQVDPCRENVSMKMRGGIRVRWVRARARLLPKLKNWPPLGLATLAMSLADTFVPARQSVPTFLTQGL